MQPDVILHNFVEALQKKIPEKTKLVETLMGILFMEKGAVNRRLRGEVPFSFYEVVNITERLNIPLNSLTQVDAVQKNRFELTFFDFSAMNEANYDRWNILVAYANSTKNYPDSEISESSNILPICMFTGFDALIKYHLFKYQYLLRGSEGRISFNDMIISERLLNIFHAYFEASKNYAMTTFIFDYMIFQYLVTEIRFFSAILLLSADDVLLIRKDLFALLDYLEELALTGCYDTTGKRVSLYISDINIDSNYVCTRRDNLYISMVRTFTLNSIDCFEQSSFLRIKNWIQSQIKSSTLITQSGATFRAEFFEKQRQLVSELKAENSH